MNQKQLSPSLNARQLRALTANAPTAKDILENAGLMSELNEEIQDTYHPEERPMPVAAPVVRKLPPVPTISDAEAELDELNRQAELKIKRKAAEQEKAAAEAEAKPVEAEQSPEEVLRGQILGALRGQKSPPSPGRIAQWKQEHGENGVYVLALNEQDVFVFTYLRRGQWQKIQQAVANAQKAELGGNSEDMLKEKVLQFTVLWAPAPLTIEFFLNSRGGTVDTLFNVIMANSSFLQLNQAMILTTQL